MTGGRAFGGFESLFSGIALLGAVACSGESSTNHDGASGGAAADGGTTAAGGTSGDSPGAATGGTGGSARPPKLGLTLLLRNPDPTVADFAGTSCPASTGIEWNIGAPITMNGTITGVDSPTPTDFGSTLENGTNDATIACRVTVDGVFRAEGGGVDPQITPPDGLVNFTFAGAAVESGDAEFTVYTPRTLALSTSAATCRFTAIHERDPGALWADFDCPGLTTPSEPSLACRASGTIVVEYCQAE